MLSEKAGWHWADRLADSMTAELEGWGRRAVWGAREGSQEASDLQTVGVGPAKIFLGR